MDRRLRANFSRAILQWLLETSAEVLIITYMTTSSSSSSFHDNGDGNDNNKTFITPGKRKNTHDDGDGGDGDGGDGNDNGTPKDDQEANMTPKGR
jgi:hypothetical protein